MTSELILDEAGLKVALEYYLEGMRSKSMGDFWLRPVNPKNITKVTIQPRIKRVKVTFESSEKES